MAATITMHAPASAPSPSPARLAAALSAIPTRPRSNLPPIELPPIRQAVPEIDLIPAREPPRYSSETSSLVIDSRTRESSPYAQKRRMITPEPTDRTMPLPQGHQIHGHHTPPYRTDMPMMPLTSAAPQASIGAYAEHPYPSRGYPEPQPPRLFDPRADYQAAVYGHDRYDSARPYPAPQYAVYDGGGAGGGKRGREFVVAGGPGYAGVYSGEINEGVGEKGGQGRKRRGNLPKETTDKLRAWFVGHLNHPYPTEDEKQELMARTGLQMNQISNWFINARRRQLPSMISNARAETAATAGGSGGASRDESDGSSYGGGSPGRGGRL